MPEGDTVDAGVVFADETLEVTFAGQLRRETMGADTFLAAGTTMELATNLTDGLSLRVGSFVAFTQRAVGGTLQPFVLEPGRTYRYALAIRPNDAQVRLWIDSERLIAAQFGTLVLPWHDDGDISYTDTASTTVLDDLDVFYEQRPRHFGDANLILPDPGVGEDLLLRAAKATFKLGRWPFMGNPNI